jgi:MFS family permease
MFSIISGPLFDQGYHRALLVAGTFLVVFGMMMTSLATEYWQLFLSQGLIIGIGAGCLFVPSVAIVATYFTTKRSLATGIVAAGGSVGSVIYPIVFRKLQPSIGFPWATRVIAFIGLSTLTISILVMRTRISHPNKSRQLVDTAAFKSIPFVVFCGGLFLSFIGLYMPFFYVIVYAQNKLKLDGNLSFYLLSLMNAASVFGRVVPGLLADKFGPLNVMIIFTFLASILGYTWIAVHNSGGLIVFCIFYGVFSGAAVSLPPTVVASLEPELRLMGTWMGMSFCFAGLGFLIGSPIAGSLIHVETNDFSGGIIFAASTVVAGGIAFLGIRVLQFKAMQKSRR